MRLNSVVLIVPKDINQSVTMLEMNFFQILYFSSNLHNYI